MRTPTAPSRTRTMIAGTAVALVLASCGAIAEKAAEELVEEAIEAEGGENVELDFDGDGNLTIETDEGTVNIDANADDGTFTIETDEGDLKIDADDDGGQTVVTDEDGNRVVQSFGDQANVPECALDIRLPDDLVVVQAIEGAEFCMFTGYVEGDVLDDVVDELEADFRTQGFSEGLSVSKTTLEDVGFVSISGSSADGEFASMMVTVDQFDDGNVQVDEATIFSYTAGQ